MPRVRMIIASLIAAATAAIAIPAVWIAKPNWIRLATLLLRRPAQIPWATKWLLPMWPQMVALLLAMALLAVAGLVLVRGRRARWLLASCVVLLLSLAAGQTLRGRSNDKLTDETAHWLRSSWETKTETEALVSVLRLGMSPVEVADAMGLPRGVGGWCSSLLRYGLTPELMHEAMGASPEPISADVPGDEQRYLVWCRPWCPNLGCCESVLVLTFADGKLRRVIDYGDVPQYDVGGHFWRDVWRRFGEPVKNLRFSPEKTLANILARNPPGIDLIPAKDSGAPR